MRKKTILVVGATGMLGNALMSELSCDQNLDVFGTVLNLSEAERFLPEKLLKKIQADVDVEDTESLVRVFGLIKPDVVINCVGFTKEPQNEEEITLSIRLNALLPHRLAKLANAFSARLIHISTDSVFYGEEGDYKESDKPSPQDIYSQTKLLGEVSLPHVLTLRTSILGHGFLDHHSLVDWFLSQKSKVKGYTQVIYSGFPTTEIARVMAEYIIPSRNLSGIYHLSSEPISKYDLLKLIAKIYDKKVAIELFDGIILKRSLDSKKFKKKTSYISPSWPKMIQKMHQYYKSNPNFIKF
ncbi:MAG: SDR family oxidoreductase [Patescibacteria group bacterium]|nr:SDR family oxidoreductase [Patescibacteria group bacterium]